ncbi:MAG TPA: carboxypeptidase-like regulatory domain-containing protein, partial [Candidatus Acidoferrum sp.]|nr:carboxypeptidase-like regulatory domain-containing protein [Candidatus Acidoferrum sp.]
MRSYLVVGLCLASICAASPLLAQRSDRGIITGIVTDPTGSAIAAAEVKVRNEGTALETTLITNSAGAFTTPPLALGNYSVIVDHAGFKQSVSSGIALQGAETIRKDITLTVGAVTESVEVKAGAELNVTTPDISHVV